MPDLNDFMSGVRILLRDSGTATFEFPHLLHLLDRLEYDTIYHEHFSYFSLATIPGDPRRTRARGLRRRRIVDARRLATGLRAPRRSAPRSDANPSPALLEREEHAGLRTLERYSRFAEEVKESKRALLDLLIRLRRDGKQVVGYGAPGKGNTLLNYCGIRTDLLDYTVDRNPHRHGLYTPGTHIPIYPPERISQTKPDYIVVLPWNLIDEIATQLAYVQEWGARLIVPIPHAAIL